MANPTFDLAKHSAYAENWLKLAAAGDNDGLFALEALVALEDEWLASKDSGDAKDKDLALELREARSYYRENYRPAPDAGVTLVTPLKE
jgi:hypothetical protein